jgi:PKD repeat protein
MRAPMAKAPTITLKPTPGGFPAVQARRAAVLGLALLVSTGALAGCLGSPQPATPAEPVKPAGQPPPPSGPNEPPRAAFEVLTEHPATGQPVRFADRSTDPDDGVAGRIWDFADGVTSRLANTSHVFALPGRYLVKLVVSDRAGQTDTAAREVAVEPGPVEPAPRPHVVVALVDTGINPYHHLFAAPGLPPPQAYVDGYPANATPLPVTLGPAYADAVKQDAAVWAGVQQGRLYYFPGTRIVGAISFGNDTFGNAAANKQAVLDDDGHGTATSSTVARNAPDVGIVMVETGAAELNEAIAWAGAQPWIDIVSISIGPVLDLPLPEWPDVLLGGAKVATQDAWTGGKLVFAAAGNEPTLSATSYVSGPTWVVAVGGAFPESHSDAGTAAKAMDIVSDYRPEVAKHDSTDGVQEESGTSFSCPAAAGAVAEALYRVRAQAGWLHGIQDGKLVAASGPGLLADGLTNQELRDAMQGVARYWDTTQYAVSDGVPVLPAPWLQMGWGYLDGSDSQALTQAVLTGQVPEKPADAQLYMAAMLQARQAFWGG